MKVKTLTFVFARVSNYETLLLPNVIKEKDQHFMEQELLPGESNKEFDRVREYIYRLTNEQVINITSCNFNDSTIYIAYHMNIPQLNEERIEKLHNEKMQLYERLIASEQEKRVLLEKIARLESLLVNS